MSPTLPTSGRFAFVNATQSRNADPPTVVTFGSDTLINEEQFQKALAGIDAMFCPPLMDRTTEPVEPGEKIVPNPVTGRPSIMSGMITLLVEVARYHPVKVTSVAVFDHVKFVTADVLTHAFVAPPAASRAAVDTLVRPPAATMAAVDTFVSPPAATICAAVTFVIATAMMLLCVPVTLPALVALATLPVNIMDDVTAIAMFVPSFADMPDSAAFVPISTTDPLVATWPAGRFVFAKVKEVATDAALLLVSIHAALSAKIAGPPVCCTVAQFS